MIKQKETCLREITREVWKDMYSYFVHFADQKGQPVLLLPQSSIDLFGQDPKTVYHNSRIHLTGCKECLGHYRIIVEGKEFNCKLEIVKEKDSKEPKAKQAMPGKPALVVA